MRKKFLIGSVIFTGLPLIAVMSCNSSKKSSSDSEYEQLMQYMEKLESKHFNQISNKISSTLNDYYLLGEPTVNGRTFKHENDVKDIKTINQNLGLSLPFNDKSTKIQSISLSYTQRLTETVWHLIIEIQTSQFVENAEIVFRSYVNTDFAKKAASLNNLSKDLREIIHNKTSLIDQADFIHSDNEKGVGFDYLASQIGFPAIRQLDNKIKDVEVEYQITSSTSNVPGEGGRFDVVATITKWGYEFTTNATFMAVDYVHNDGKIAENVIDKIQEEFPTNEIWTTMDHEFPTLQKNQNISWEAIGLDFGAMEFIYNLQKQYNVKIKIWLNSDITPTAKTASVTIEAFSNKSSFSSFSMNVKRLSAIDVVEDAKTTLMSNYVKKGVAVSGRLSNDSLYKVYVPNPKPLDQEVITNIFKVQSDPTNGIPVIEGLNPKHVNITYTYTKHETLINTNTLKIFINAVNPKTAIENSTSTSIELLVRSKDADATQVAYENVMKKYPTDGIVSVQAVPEEKLLEVRLQALTADQVFDTIFGKDNPNKPDLIFKSTYLYGYTIVKEEESERYIFTLRIRYLDYTTSYSETMRRIEYYLVSKT